MTSARRKREIRSNESRSASERGMRRAGIAELPGARRAWMGPPLAALGLMSPRTSAAPFPNRCARTSKAVAEDGRLGPTSPRLADLCAKGRLMPERHSTTSRDGVAHEAPLSPVWRGPKSARVRYEPHAST